MKLHGFAPVLDKFCSEMLRLSRDGFLVDLPVIGKQQVFISLCQFACDNLALNGLLGFIQSFSGVFLHNVLCDAQCNSNMLLREKFSSENKRGI